MGRRKTYTRLIRMLQANGYDQPAVAEQLGLGVSSVSRRYRGKDPWHLDEMYKLMDLLNEPYENLHKLFPKNGIEENVKTEEEQTELDDMLKTILLAKKLVEALTKGDIG